MQICKVHFAIFPQKATKKATFRLLNVLLFFVGKCRSINLQAEVIVGIKKSNHV